MRGGRGDEGWSAAWGTGPRSGWVLVVGLGWGRSLVEELLIAATEALPVGGEAGRRDGWIAEAGVVIEGGWAAGLDVMPGGFESVVHALLLDGLVVEWRRWRRGVDGLRVGAAGGKEPDEQHGGAEKFLHREYPS